MNNEILKSVKIPPNLSQILSLIDDNLQNEEAKEKNSVEQFNSVGANSSVYDYKQLGTVASIEFSKICAQATLETWSKIKEREIVSKKNIEQRNKELFEIAASVGKFQALLSNAKKESCSLVGAALKQKIDVVSNCARQLEEAVIKRDALRNLCREEEVLEKSRLKDFNEMQWCQYGQKIEPLLKKLDEEMDLNKK